MNKEYKEMLTEVYAILKNMSDSDVSKIPIKLQEFIRDNKSAEYNFTIDENIPFLKQKLKKETIDFLALLCEKYLCEDKEKTQLHEILKKNEIEYQQELRKKYNPENIFNNN